MMLKMLGIFMLPQLWSIPAPKNSNCTAGSPAFFLTKVMGLAGFWVSMCIELNIRGILFLWRLKSGKWMRVRLQTEK